MIALIFALVLLVGAFLLAGAALAPQQRDISGRINALQKQAAKPGLRDSEEMNKSFFVRIMLPLADRVGKYVHTPQGSIESARKAIAAAGMTGKVNPIQIISLQYMLGIGMPVMVFLLVLNQPKTPIIFGMVGLCAMIGYRLPIGIISGKASARKHEIRKALPFTLDLICISVEAGVAMDGALRIVADKTSGPLTDEINMTLREIQLGKGRSEGLADLGERVGVDDLKSFITAVNYISRLGGSLVDVIRIQAEAMRIKRKQRAEEKAMKTPVKIMIPLVLFIFPSMFIVILGPAAIQLYIKIRTTQEINGSSAPVPSSKNAPK